jgi:hypothetical protein
MRRMKRKRSDALSPELVSSIRGDLVISVYDNVDLGRYRRNKVDGRTASPVPLH